MANYICSERIKRGGSLILKNGEKCIDEMFDAKIIMPTIIENYYDVKASIVVVKMRILFTIFKCDCADADLFPMVNIGHSAIHRVIGSCFYFNKDQLLIFFDNEINLALRDTKVLASNAIATFYKVACGYTFSQAGQILFRTFQHVARKSLTYYLSMILMVS